MGEPYKPSRQAVIEKRRAAEQAKRDHDAIVSPRPVPEQGLRINVRGKRRATNEGAEVVGVRKPSTIAYNPVTGHDGGSDVGAG